MTDITKFLTKHPLDKKVGQFAEGELEAYRDKIPDELYQFLQQEQKSVYGNGFFRTVSPKDFHDVFTNWGLDGDNCHAFLISSFGCIEYYYDNDYCGFNPHTGTAHANSPQWLFRASAQPGIGKHYQFRNRLLLRHAPETPQYPAGTKRRRNVYHGTRPAPGWRYGNIAYRNCKEGCAARYTGAAV